MVIRFNRCNLYLDNRKIKGGRMSIKEGIQAILIGSPNNDSPEKLSDQIISYLKSQIEQMENPYRPFPWDVGSNRDAFEKMRRDILSKLQ